MAYTGPERRIHRVLVTQNTEYHMRRRTCVRVRDRRTGEWIEDHGALMSVMTGAFAIGRHDADVNLSDIPMPGECVFFDARNGQLITSPILRVERPARELVMTSYPQDGGNC